MAMTKRTLMNTVNTLLIIVIFDILFLDYQQHLINKKQQAESKKQQAELFLLTNKDKIARVQNDFKTPVMGFAERG